MSSPRIGGDTGEVKADAGNTGEANADGAKTGETNALWLRGELLRALSEQAGLEIVALTPAEGGESRTVFVATDRAGAVSIVKVGAHAQGYLRALAATTARLRDLQYPAPRLLGAGHVQGMAFWVQELLPGEPLDPADLDHGEPDFAGLVRLLPELIRLNDAQAGLGARAGSIAGTESASGWPDLIRQTLSSGGHGYCIHATLEARPATRDLLAALRRTGDRCYSAIPAGDDFVHYDFTPANLLSDGTAITGVIDVNPPVLAGDRAFDVATLLFYCYDHDVLRDRLRARLLELTNARAARAYLAHMVLRQVEWSLRYHPGTASTRRFLRLGRLVVGDIDGIG